MASFEERIACGFDGAFIDRSPLEWVARDSSKPGRAEEPDAWVLHATPEWSADHLGVEAPDAAAILLGEFSSLTGTQARRPASLIAHLWQHARSEKPLAEEVLIDFELGLAVCGDWLAGDRIEGAFRSGRAAANALLRFGHAWPTQSVQ
jgi:predicted NAD/FAD-dependent oxidoreductase